MKELPGAALLHQLTQVHHADVVGDVLDHAEVMGDENIGQPALLLQILHEIEDLRLDGHIQGGDRLVAHDEPGVEGQRPGDADALAAASVQLVGIYVRHPLRQTNRVHELRHPAVILLPAGAGLIDPHGFADDIRHPHSGIDGGVGVLEDDLHLPAQLLELLLGGLGNILPVIEDRPIRPLQQVEDHTPQGRFPAAGLAYHAQCFPLLQLKAHIVHRMKHSTGRGEILFQVFDLQNGSHYASPPSVFTVGAFARIQRTRWVGDIWIFCTGAASHASVR